MFDELRDVAETLRGGNDNPVIRFGTVDAVDAGPPVIVTIAGHPMPCLASYTTPTVGDVVIWLNHQSRAVALGKQQ